MRTPYSAAAGTLAGRQEALEAVHLIGRKTKMYVEFDLTNLVEVEDLRILSHRAGPGTVFGFPSIRPSRRT